MNIDKIEYRTSRNAKKNGKKAILVRISGKWELLAKLNNPALAEFEGDLTEDEAKIGVLRVYGEYKINAPEGVVKAAEKAAAAIKARELKKALKKCATFEEGEEKFLSTQAEKAAKAWEKLTEFVEEFRANNPEKEEQGE